MIWLLLAAVVVGALAWLGRRSASRKGDWRAAAGFLAVAAAVTAGFLALTGRWPVAIVTALIGAWLSLSAKRGVILPTPGMSEARARSILGVGPGAAPDEIQAAYRRLMAAVHPDKGGSEGLAAELNAARDRLIRG